MSRYVARSSTTSIHAGVVPLPHLSPTSSIVYDGHHVNLLNKNRMLLLRLEQLNILAPGVLTIDATGELVAYLSSTKEPDSDTMAGLFSNRSPCSITTTAADMMDERQIPSWLRDYLVRELDVYGHGPPAGSAALYDHLRKSQEGSRVNTSVRTAEMLLRCASMSVRHAVQVAREFVETGWMVEDMYEVEVGLVVRTVERLVTCSMAEVGGDGGDDNDNNNKKKKKRKNKKGQKLPKDIQLVLDIGSMGVVMKSAMEASLQSLVVEPYSRLVEKLDMVAQGLRKEEREREAEEGENEHGFVSDSGVDEC